MMSRTVRYFKLIYIVAGILMSREDVCDTVDQIKIAPRVEVFNSLRPISVYRGFERALVLRWRKHFSGIKRRLKPVFEGFSIWTVPNYLLDFSTQYISNMLIMDSDCNMIYNR